MLLLTRYRSALANGELKPDAAQDDAVRKLAALAERLRNYRGGHGFFFRRARPRGLYIWGDVGRGKSLLMDMFFDAAPLAAKRRAHFNAFMVDVHARLHEERQRAESTDPIALVARALASEASLLCFDEFQVSDVGDAMILGRLFEQLFARGVVVVATSNTAPAQLYEGGLNRQLFLPFIVLLEKRLEVLELDGAVDYRLERMAGLEVYLTPLSAQSDKAMDAAFRRLTDQDRGDAMTLTILGRPLQVPETAKGVARFSFAALCARPLAAADYLALARHFHTLLIDRIPVLTAELRNEARRFTVLIDTLYDEGVKLVCSAAAAPEGLFEAGDGADAFRRTVSRLIEMQSEDYLKRGHGVHGLLGAHFLESPPPA